jgi:N-acetylmuramoyl-L-alanine amidase
MPEQEERWINTQQVIGMLCAYLADTGPKPDIKFAVPTGQFERLVPETQGDAGCIIEVGDSFSLTARYKLANSLGRWLIEFHNNSAPFTASGAEVIAYSKSSGGYGLGESVMRELKGAGMKDRGVKTMKELGRELTLLKKTAKPCIILEGGFLSSGKDMKGLDVDLDSYNEQYGVLVYRAVKSFWMARQASA